MPFFRDARDLLGAPWASDHDPDTRVAGLVLWANDKFKSVLEGDSLRGALRLGADAVFLDCDGRALDFFRNGQEVPEVRDVGTCDDVRPLLRSCGLPSWFWLWLPLVFFGVSVAGMVVVVSLFPAAAGVPGLRLPSAGGFSALSRFGCM